jgi:HK97 family phage prohead protease
MNGASTIERRRASQYRSSSNQAPRVDAGAGRFAFSGYVVRWDSLSEDLGGFREIIRRGAFSKVIADTSRNVIAVLDHEKRVLSVLGDTASGTLHLVEDDAGLAFLIQAGDTQAARDAAKIVGRNTIGVSFAFICGKDCWSQAPDGSRIREILDVALLDEISLVVDAAYKSSEVSAVEMSAGAGARARPTVEYLRRNLDLAEMEMRIAAEAGDDPASGNAPRFAPG